MASQVKMKRVVKKRIVPAMKKNITHSSREGKAHSVVRFAIIYLIFDYSMNIHALLINFLINIDISRKLPPQLRR
jgi:hypothetical protein